MDRSETRTEYRVVGDEPLEFEMEVLSRFDAEWVRTRARSNGSANVRIQQRSGTESPWEDVSDA